MLDHGELCSWRVGSSVRWEGTPREDRNLGDARVGECDAERLRACGAGGAYMPRSVGARTAECRTNR